MSSISTNNELRNPLTKRLQQARASRDSLFELLDHIYTAFRSVEA